MADGDLRAAVQQELDREPGLDASQIGVAASSGVVRLSGHVESYPEKHQAVRAAARVRGVQAVVIDLDVRLPGTNFRTDEEIAQAAANAIQSNALLPKGGIKVRVEKGRVTLEGAVEWQHQRAAADRCVRYLAGVRDLNNHIVVHPEVRRDVGRGDIETALLRNAELDSKGIRVETRGGRVILWGCVQSWAERAEAERAAWGSPGVCHVDDNIRVEASGGHRVAVSRPCPTCPK